MRSVLICSYRGEFTGKKGIVRRKGKESESGVIIQFRVSGDLFGTFGVDYRIIYGA